ncbi:glycosyltransferase [Serratia sp. PF2-63]|uniref:glycosyltransferase n=1 Tax=unclassified Serratia (in: enterobacteria) TaxID=2647522 RepID=UPI0024AF069D|nr:MULTISPECIES: glycosyltransferase [unclassified Serratia (in: enterobacteria)]MDI6974295.1 glycosyltransferase [Serratia sp. Se-RSBMAAmG]MDI9262573.1 glycosyltransferase [Serratia sp. PF2-63]MDI9270920.1 glycosyltransferase [Serratia sp. PF-27]
MRFLMIIDGLPGGGAEKVVLTLSESIHKMGHHVTLYSLGEKCVYSLPVGVEYRVIISHSNAPWRKLTELTRRAKKLDSVLRLDEEKNGKYDIIISNLHKTDRIVAQSCVINTSRLWYCIHGVLSSTYLGHRKGINYWFKKFKMKRIYKNRNIIAVSQSVLDDIVKVLGVRPAKSTVINNPFDLYALKKRADEFCELSGTNYLINVARIHPQKRQDRLLRAFALSGLSSRAKLVLLGTGTEERIAVVKRLADELNIAGSVLFLGFQSNPFPYMKHARMMVMSSDSEGFGNVIVESLILGTPVISTCCPGGPQEILKKVGLPEMLTDLDVEALSKMIDVYDNLPIIDESGLESYDVRTISLQYIKLGTH